MNAWVAVKRLLKFLGFEFTGPVGFQVTSVDPETHSLVVVLPPAPPAANQADDLDDPAGAGDQAPAVS